MSNCYFQKFSNLLMGREILLYFCIKDTQTCISENGKNKNDRANHSLQRSTKLQF